MSVIEEIAAERCRQIEAEGWTAEHDDKHESQELAVAAACYALLAAGWRMTALREIWPRSWSGSWFKRSGPRRALIKAAAMIVAEIDRLDRAAAKEPRP